MTRAYYSETIADFVHQDTVHILGVLTTNNQFQLDELQRNTWIAQIEILKNNLADINSGHIIFEYTIPRMGKRVDVVLLVHGVVFVIEFKVGDSQYKPYALDQVLDYGLDLKNFHEQSHTKPIIPILVATQADAVKNGLKPFDDQLFEPLKANKDNLGQVLLETLSAVSATDFDPILWQNSLYSPTPTIVEAAQALYRGHNVREISRADAEAINLSLTAEAISEIVDNAKGNQTKVICFVTGVPGAGKTLAGLNIANERLRTDQDEHAVFLSGNGPLVKVLREALTRDELSRLPNPHTGMTRKLVLSKVEAFIQNIHHFRDDAIDSNAPPVEKVVVFDEAQRAWTLEQTESFMKRKRRIEHFGMSEPQFLISVMDRHSDWAVIVCLVGGGQEINTGEAGLIEWLDAVKTNFPNWEVWCAHNLLDDEYTRGQKISELIGSTKLQFDSRLHLAISLRSFRSENVSGLVKALLDNDCEKAIDLLQAIGESYPIVITRDLATARHWLKTKARGTERFGLLASSGAIRLRPIGINVKSEIDVVDWFLNKKSDIRSSYFLEEVASEFDIQGLELDWTCVIWDADLRYIQDKWDFKLFRGTDWYNVNDSARMRYLKNSYRVLLTRARQGMVIVVPKGSDEDQTRKPEFYDGTYYYLRKIGFEVIQPINS